MSTVTVSAPLEPKTVYWLSTSTPIAVVIAQPSAHSAPSAGTQANARRPSRGRSTTAWAAPMASPQIAPWTTRSPMLVP